jgi:hypothetical protein
MRAAPGLLVGLVLGTWLSAPARSAPIAYSFTTGDQPTTVPLIFAPGTSVSGTFAFDASAGASGTHANGSTLYAGSAINLSGSVAGHAFSDASGLTAVGDDVIVGSSATPTDFLLVSGDPVAGAITTPENLAGFTIGNLKLVNVRLLWIEGQLGAPDFLTNQNLPGALPALEGRLALDFVDLTNPTGPTVSVFFDGLRAVPEPTTLSLLPLALLALARRRDDA